MRKLKKIIGWSMVAAPFVALFLYIMLEINIWAALIVYGGTAFFVLLLWVAVTLIFDE